MDEHTVSPQPSHSHRERCGHPVTLPDEHAVVESAPSEQAGARQRVWHGSCFEDFLDQNEET